MSSWFVTNGILARCSPFEVVLNANDFFAGYWIFKQSEKRWMGGLIWTECIQFYTGLNNTGLSELFSAMVDSFRNINTRQMAIETWL